LTVTKSTSLTLSVQDLSVSYRTVYGTLRALNRVTLAVERGESVSIVGESGCGKSTLGLSIVRLLPLNSAYESGRVFLEGKHVVKMNSREVSGMRGSSAFMIFQDPLNTLNPVKRIDIQMLEALRTRASREGKKFDEEEAYDEAVEHLRDVRMPDPEAVITRYPHQLSGGQIQRVVISIGLLMRPKLMIADEPTSALDVTIQAQVLKLMRDLQREYQMSIIFITHDINVAHSISDRMVVMYAGEVVESASSDSLVRDPKHPYTKALISSIPRTSKREGRLTAIKGAPPNMLNPPKGCRFNPRCPFVMDVCRAEEPRAVVAGESDVRCFLYDKHPS
jgi:peptide/nickel transport system ATP-binding protein